MTGIRGVRVSPSFHDLGSIDEAALRRHSFDLVHFPLFLARSVPPRVRIDVFDDRPSGPALMGCYRDDADARSWKYASLVADDLGCLTDSDEFYLQAHAAFAGRAGALTYQGFTRAAAPVYAPLFALAMLYKRFGRGMYEPGNVLPTPWPELTLGLGEFTASPSPWGFG